MEPTSETTAVASASTSAAPTAIVTDSSPPVTESDTDGLPDWLKPGVSPGIHMGLRVVFLVLNVLLGYCALMRILSPHFEFMFLLSLGLTGCYFWFIFELGKIHAQSALRQEATAETRSAVENVKEENSGQKEESKKDL